ncbi:MAG TPA: DNA gyrase inhibitor YacG [Methyloceanibacter sp.]
MTAGRSHSGPRKATPKRPRCPICGKPAVDNCRPFCSATCADIDLGRWLGGRYAVPGEPVSDDEADDDEPDINS